jgi:hypothetical protein
MGVRLVPPQRFERVEIKIFNVGCRREFSVRNQHVCVIFYCAIFISLVVSVVILFDRVVGSSSS